MADYRLYYLNTKAKRIVDAAWIVAAGDDEAIAEAQALASSEPFELWIGNRLVAGSRERSSPGPVLAEKLATPQEPQAGP